MMSVLRRFEAVPIVVVTVLCLRALARLAVGWQAAGDAAPA
jgi:hypothetical protein